MDDYVFVIDEGGVEFIHDDELNDVRESLGAPYRISRAGNVNFDNARKGFAVNIPGVGDLGTVYDRRGDAIRAEVSYLSEQMCRGIKISDVHKKGGNKDE